MKDSVKETIIVLLAMLWSALWGIGFGLLIKQNDCDVNNDGKVTAADYVVIRNYIMESE